MKANEGKGKRMTTGIDKLIADRIAKELEPIKEELERQYNQLREELMKKEEVQEKVQIEKEPKKVKEIIKKPEPKKVKEIIKKPEPTTIEERELELIEVTFLNLQKEANKHKDSEIMNKERLYRVVAYNLKKIRADNDLSQKEVAEMSGMKYATYTSIEQGRGFSLESVFIIANGLGITPSDLLTTD